MNSNNPASIPQDVVLGVVDGVKVVVPDSLELITPYVLREQLDWFEDEIKFVRTLLQPGDVVLDIGANYGLYALSMAKVVGGSGHVYAFEPASKTASYLQRSIEQNSFGHITLIRAALSNRSGAAEFGLNDLSELNSLDTSIASRGNTETVNLTTLDIFAADFSLRNVKFIKLDAEGEEGNIIKGGECFLNNASPLIMFELMHLEKINTPLIQQFKNIGYELYRLIPDLNVLAPFALDRNFDEYQLNLFACNNDCATRLEQEGKLIKGKSAAPDPIGTFTNWEELVFQHPYANRLKFKWQAVLQGSTAAGNENDKKYLDILSLYASAHKTVAITARYSMLNRACISLRGLCGQAPTLPRWISLSRIESELGQRNLSLTALDEAFSLVMKGKIMLDEPFLATSVRFEQLDPENRMTSWLIASLLEQLEKLNFFSSYYSGNKTLQRLLEIRKTGFQSAEMDRRIQLITQRFSMLA